MRIVFNWQQGASLSVADRITRSGAQRVVSASTMYLLCVTDSVIASGPQSLTFTRKRRNRRATQITIGNLAHIPKLCSFIPCLTRTCVKRPFRYKAIAITQWPIIGLPSSWLTGWSGEAVRGPARAMRDVLICKNGLVCGRAGYGARWVGASVGGRSSCAGD